ncbi:MAG: MarC family protein [Chitinivibrionales bacterium]|nr:MarC family protein [Chitinivibrionales bacterium]MBD3395060.1 MarC family protein [Chitinivibrionales bacterium]
MDYGLILKDALYLLAIINPASKILFLSSIHPRRSARELLIASLQASVVAVAMLLLFSAAGYFILHTVFHVELYSLKVAGGIVLFTIGLRAIQEGRFFQVKAFKKLSDISVVPLAAPMIAGPGTLTAAISFSSEHGLAPTATAIMVAVAVNFLVLLSSIRLGDQLEKVSALGPLVRITGLIVAAVAVQMVLAGIGEWLRALGIL